MSKIYALKGHQPGEFVAGRHGTIDSRKLTEAKAKELIRQGFKIEEISLVTMPKVKPAAKSDTKLPESETVVDPQSENSTAS